MAIFAFGTELKQSDMAETPDFKTVAKIESISGPDMSADEIDITAHDSGEDGFREFVQGLKDPGSVTLEGHLVPTDTTHTDLIAAYKSGDVTDFELVFPDADSTTWKFAAFITGFEVESPLDDKTQFTASMKLTGEPTLNDA